MSLVSVNIHQK